MRKVLSALFTIALIGTVSPASAAAAGGSSASPAAYCRASFEQLTNPVTGLTFGQYVIDVEFSFGGQTVVEEFGLSSFQACVSTVAAGMGDDGVVAASAISKPAYLAQCDFLQRAGVVTYPYAFYGVYPAKNRADCARILQGVHSGTLPLPGPPPVG